MFSKLLSETEEWLYDEGEDQNKQVYLDKFAQLQVSLMKLLFCERSTDTLKVYNCGISFFAVAKRIV